MQIRLLFATPEAEFLKVLDSVIESALELTPLQVTTAAAAARQPLLQRVDAGADDVVVLDWSLAGPATPDLVRELLQRNPQVRVVALLPEIQRQYRQQVWAAGACSSIPKEHIDQEWLSSILCVMYRAMEREMRLRAAFAAGEPLPAPCGGSCCVAVEAAASD
jgi:DNA-binding NarL/FixJ family response regulator